MNTFCNSRWHFNVWDGVYCIFSVASVIEVEHFVFWMANLILWTVNLIFWRTFHFREWVFGELDHIFGILDGNYAIQDDYLVFKLKYFVFLRVYLEYLATYFIFGNTTVCILDYVFCFFDDFLVFGKVHFRGPTVRGPICHFFRADSWAPDNRAPGYFCYFFMMCDFFCNSR